jgi:hypothetical protein
MMLRLAGAPCCVESYLRVACRCSWNMAMLNTAAPSVTAGGSQFLAGLADRLSEFRSARERLNPVTDERPQAAVVESVDPTISNVGFALLDQDTMQLLRFRHALDACSCVSVTPSCCASRLTCACCLALVVRQPAVMHARMTLWCLMRLSNRPQKLEDAAGESRR